MKVLTTRVGVLECGASQISQISSFKAGAEQKLGALQAKSSSPLGKISATVSPHAVSRYRLALTLTQVCVPAYIQELVSSISNDCSSCNEDSSFTSRHGPRIVCKSYRGRQRKPIAEQLWLHYLKLLVGPHVLADWTRKKMRKHRPKTI